MTARWLTRGAAVLAAADTADAISVMIWRQQWPWQILVIWQAAATGWMIAYLYQARTIRLLRETAALKDTLIELLKNRRTG